MNNNKLRLECCICLDDKFFVSRTPCNHSICIDCLFRLKQTICPYCRYDLEKDLPGIVKDKILNNKKKEKNSNLELNNDYEFPPLN